MNDDRIGPLVGRIYDGIELAPWASLIAGAIVFALFIAPGIPAASNAAPPPAPLRSSARATSTAANGACRPERAGMNCACRT